MSTIKIEAWKEVENKLAARIFKQINPASTIEVTSQPYFLENTDANPGDTLEFMTGTWSGGIEPIRYEYRYKLFFPELNDGKGQWVVQGDFIEQPNENVVRTITLSLLIQPQPESTSNLALMMIMEINTTTVTLEISHNRKLYQSPTLSSQEAYLCL